MPTVNDINLYTYLRPNKKKHELIRIIYASVHFITLQVFIIIRHKITMNPHVLSFKMSDSIVSHFMHTQNIYGF